MKWTLVIAAALALVVGEVTAALADSSVIRSTTLSKPRRLELRAGELADGGLIGEICGVIAFADGGTVPDCEACEPGAAANPANACVQAWRIANGVQ